MKARPAAADLTPRIVVDRALRFYAQHDKYTCRVSRQERVGAKVMPQETMLMNFRLEPRSVYYKWLDEKNLGRECVYVAGANEGKIITRGGRGDFLLNGKRVRVDPNGILARGKSRYSITESGIDNMVRRLETVIAVIESGSTARGSVEVKGLVRRDDLDRPALHLLQQIPVGADPYFPEGGIRHWYFDPETGQFLLMHATDLAGRFIEYYRFDRFVPNPLLGDRDFDPDHLWQGKTTTDEETGAKPGRSAEGPHGLPK